MRRIVKDYLLSLAFAATVMYGIGYLSGRSEADEFAEMMSNRAQGTIEMREEYRPASDIEDILDSYRNP